MTAVSIGLAGIMGGLSTAVTDKTTDVFFEAAFWPQDFMAGRARSYGMHTDASLRFERGVDPQGQARAVERATELLVKICGGEPGPLVRDVSEKHLPVPQQIHLRRERVIRLLGLELDDKVVVDILERLGLDVAPTNDGWQVTAPAFRFDLASEVDLIEEIVRMHGYDEVPETTETAQTPLQTVTETTVDLERVSDTLIARDYEEAITYSFIDAQADAAFLGEEPRLVLSNPISSEMSVMRSSLWPGLIVAAAANIARQQDRVRLFEIGKSFHGTLDAHEEVLRLAAIASGCAVPEQWGTRAQAIDFFDIKSDVEAILELSGNAGDFEYVPVSHPALQPGQAANILRGDDVIGVSATAPEGGKTFRIKTPHSYSNLTLRKHLPLQCRLPKPFRNFRQSVGTLRCHRRRQNQR